MYGTNVPSIELDRSRIEAFLVRAADTLQGDWLLIGGAAAAMWFAATRTTEDIDLVGADGTNQERLRLMDVADAEGLPVEVVNSAADYFVRRVPSWDTEKVELVRGRSATIYRPTATMYLLFKLRRLSEEDLDDCRALLAWCNTSGERVDVARALAELKALPATPDLALAGRRDELVDALTRTRSVGP